MFYVFWIRFMLVLPIWLLIWGTSATFADEPVNGCGSQIAVRADLINQWTEKAVTKLSQGQIPGTTNSLDMAISSKASESLSKSSFGGVVVVPKEVFGDVSNVGLAWRGIKAIRGKDPFNGEKTLAEVNVDNVKIKNLKLGDSTEWKWEKIDNFHQKIRIPVDDLAVTADLKIQEGGSAKIAKVLAAYEANEAKYGRKIDPAFEKILRESAGNSTVTQYLAQLGAEEAKHGRKLDPEFVKALKFDPELLDPNFHVGVHGLKLSMSKDLNPKKEQAYVEVEVEVTAGSTVAEGLHIVPGATRLSLPLKSMDLGLDTTPEEVKKYIDVMNASPALKSLDASKPRGPQKAPEKCGGFMTLVSLLDFTWVSDVADSVGEVKDTLVAGSNELKRQGHTDNLLSYLYLQSAGIALDGIRASDARGNATPSKIDSVAQSVNSNYEKAINDQVSPMVAKFVSSQIYANQDLHKQIQFNVPITTLGQMLQVPDAVPSKQKFPVTVTEVGPDTSGKFLVGNLSTCPPSKLPVPLGPPRPTIELDPENPIAQGYDVAGVVSRADLNRYLKVMTSDQQGADAISDKIDKNPTLKGLQLDQKVSSLLAGPPQIIREYNPKTQKYELSLEIMRKTGTDPERLPLSDDMKLFAQGTGGMPVSAETRTIAVKSLEIISGVLKARSVELEGLLLPDLDPETMTQKDISVQGVQLKLLQASQKQDGVVFGVNLGDELLKKVNP